MNEWMYATRPVHIVLPQLHFITAMVYETRPTHTVLPLLKSVSKGKLQACWRSSSWLLTVGCQHASPDTSFDNTTDCHQMAHVLRIFWCNQAIWFSLAQANSFHPPRGWKLTLQDYFGLSSNIRNHCRMTYSSKWQPTYSGVLFPTSMLAVSKINIIKNRPSANGSVKHPRDVGGSKY